MRGRPCAIIFADLVKAYDLAAREIAIGFRKGISCGEATRRLQALGFSEATAGELVDEIAATGGLLARSRLQPGLTEVLRDLHEPTWFPTLVQELLCTATSGAR